MSEAPMGRTLCPLVTPFADGGDTVDRGALASLVEHVLDGGIGGLVPCGTTGEFASLDDEEYRTVLESVVNAGGDRAPVVAGTASPSVSGTLDRVRTAADAGADAALITQPYFHTANDAAGNLEFFSRIADRTELPLYLYNIPSCTGQEIAPSVAARLADREAVRGLKDSGGDFGYFMSVDRNTPEEFELYQGFDSYLVPGMMQGGTGGINALSNAIPEAFAAAADAVVRGEIDEARRIHAEQIAPLFQRCIDHGFAPATKAALGGRDVPLDATVRPPLVELSESSRGEVEAMVADIVASYD